MRQPRLRLWRHAGALFISAVIVSFFPACAPSQPHGLRPAVIAHRGASAYLPEHTLEAYALAFGLGADFIEPDVVFTRDAVAICAHDIVMEEVTDVARRFPGRARHDGRWYWVDFTLAEVRTLSKTGRRSELDSPDDRGYGVATLAEMIAMVDRLNRAGVSTARSQATAVGVVPELKRPDFYNNENAPGLPAGFEPVRAFIEALHGAGAIGLSGDPRSGGVPTIVQCFDLDAIERMATMTKLPLVWLCSGEPSLADLDRAAACAHGLGPSRNQLLDESGRETPLSAHATARGLSLYPWTFKDEPDAIAMIAEVPGVVGVFSDNPDVARRSLQD